MSDFRREIRFEPGFDHRNDPEESKYGCHGMDIRFLLHGERGSVQFLIYSGWLPGQSWPHWRHLQPMPADVGYHWDSPFYAEQDRRECELRPGGFCHYDGSGLAAVHLFEKFTREGEAAVWAELERRYAELEAR